MNQLTGVDARDAIVSENLGKSMRAIYLIIGALFSSAQNGFENKSAIWFGNKF